MDADIAIGRRITVHSIADDRVPDGGAVDVQLVSPSSNTGEGETGFAILLPYDLVLRNTVLLVLEDLLSHVLGIESDEGALALLGRDAHVRRILVVHHEGELDRATVVSDLARDEGLVLPHDLPGPELSVQVAQRGVSAGKDHEAGGVHPQAVADHLTRVAGFAPEGVEDGTLHGRVADPAGDGEDAGGLVDHDDVLVLVDDLEVLLAQRLGRLVLLSHLLLIRGELRLELGRVDSRPGFEDGVVFEGGLAQRRSRGSPSGRDRCERGSRGGAGDEGECQG
mmetsp:Transcript_22885/g.67568  ORF Transcript_22885/g.67568 Transcript_22885/m.67568 type:complete len:281 (-) Transcript_22885:308-1150(-)